MRASDATIRNALGEIFAAAPEPRPAGELAETLVDQGLDLGGDPEDRLHQALQLDTRFADVGDRLVFVPALVEGTRWTTAVDGEEARQGFVRLQPDLSVLSWWLVEGGVELVDDAGERLGELETEGLDLDGVDTDVLLGPDGWLKPLAGGLASVEVIGGALRWMPCDVEPQLTAAQVEAVRRGFERAAHDESFSDMTLEDAVALTFAILDRTLREALVADRQAFLDDPVPRLDTLLAAAGLERRGPLLAAEGFDWGHLATWQRRKRAMWEHGLDDEGAEQLSMLVGACDLVLEGDPNALGTDEQERVGGAALLAAILEANEDVATAFWTSRSEDLAADDVLRFADALVDELGEATPGVTWLRARSLDALGRVPEAIKALDAVVAAGTAHPLVLIDAAGFAADRGDAATARRLLARAGADDHLREHDGEFTHSSPDLDLLAEVLPFAQRPKPIARRNDPCPCGSGKKYKACHLRTELHPLEERAGWLYGKAIRHLRRDDPAAVVELAREMAGDVGLMAGRELVDAPLIVDLALHEDGGFADFVATRSDLLPDDEALLAAQWELVDRSVFEIERSAPGRLELRDVGRGEHVTVTGVEYDTMPRPGTLLLGRPLPVGDTYRAFGGFFPVPRHVVDDLLDAIATGDALGIASVMAGTFGAPGMVNSDGHPMVFHEVRWQLPEGASEGSVEGVLGGRGLERMEGTEPPTWTLVRDTANQPRAMILTLRLEDEHLVGEVNSDRRAEEMRQLVEEAFPAATVVAEERRSVEEALRDHDGSEAPGDEPDMDDPAIQEVLREMMRQHEVRWIDEEIPALGGRTPREAVGDPVGRVEVLQLLASFPEPDERGIGMDPARIRSMLGL